MEPDRPPASRRSGGEASAKVAEVEVVAADATEWRAWLAANHDIQPAAWVAIAKKGVTNPTSLTYAEAVEEAACFGWVDGLMRGKDEGTYRQRFSPRKPKGNWTEGNVALALRLIAEGRMEPAGLAAVERGRAAGRFPAG